MGAHGPEFTNRDVKQSCTQSTLLFTFSFISAKISRYRSVRYNRRMITGRLCSSHESISEVLGVWFSSSSFGNQECLSQTVQIPSLLFSILHDSKVTIIYTIKSSLCQMRQTIHTQRSTGCNNNIHWNNFRFTNSTSLAFFISSRQPAHKLRSQVFHTQKCSLMERTKKHESSEHGCPSIWSRGGTCPLENAIFQIVNIHWSNQGSRTGEHHHFYKPTWSDPKGSILQRRKISQRLQP